jgi:hypothetical protein
MKEGQTMKKTEVNESMKKLSEIAGVSLEQLAHVRGGLTGGAIAHKSRPIVIP